jgi:ABC-type branched-subunit amino acid transport system substrate-binding protein
MRAKNPDAILFAHEPEGMIKAARQLGFNKPLIAANNVLEMLSSSENHRPELDGIYVVDLPISAEFRKKFAERFKRAPILEAYAGYEAVRVIAEASRMNRVDIAEGIRLVRYAGIAGEIDFTKRGCAGNGAHWELFRFVNGEQVRQ